MNYQVLQKSCDKPNFPETYIRASITLHFSKSSGRWFAIATASPPHLGRGLLDPFLTTAPSPWLIVTLCAPWPHTPPELHLPLDWSPAHSGFGFDFKLGDLSEKRRKKLVEVVVRYVAQEGPSMQSIRRSKVKGARFPTHTDGYTSLNSILLTPVAVWIPQQWGET